MTEHYDDVRKEGADHTLPVTAFAPPRYLTPILKSCFFVFFPTFFTAFLPISSSSLRTRKLRNTRQCLVSPDTTTTGIPSTLSRSLAHSSSPPWRCDSYCNPFCRHVRSPYKGARKASNESTCSVEAQEREFAVVSPAAAAAPHNATAEIEQALRLQSLERFIRRMNIKDRTASASRRARVEAARRRSVCGTGVAQRKSLGNATKEKLRRIMMLEDGEQEEEEEVEERPATAAAAAAAAMAEAV